MVAKEYFQDERDRKVQEKEKLKQLLVEIQLGEKDESTTNALHPSV